MAEIEPWIVRDETFLRKISSYFHPERSVRITIEDPYGGSINLQCKSEFTGIIEKIYIFNSGAVEMKFDMPEITRFKVKMSIRTGKNRSDVDKTILAVNGVLERYDLDPFRWGYIANVLLYDVFNIRLCD